MKKIAILAIAAIAVAAFVMMFRYILIVNPNEHKIEALSSAIATFETMLTENEERESMPIENVVLTEKAIKKFRSQRRWQQVGNVIMATVFGLMASGFSVWMSVLLSHRLVNARKTDDEETETSSKLP